MCAYSFSSAAAITHLRWCGARLCRRLCLSLIFSAVQCKLKINILDTLCATGRHCALLHALCICVLNWKSVNGLIVMLTLLFCFNVLIICIVNQCSFVTVSPDPHSVSSGCYLPCHVSLLSSSSVDLGTVSFGILFIVRSIRIMQTEYSKKGLYIFVLLLSKSQLNVV